MVGALERRPGLLRWTAVGSLAFAVATAGWTVSNSWQQRRAAREELRAQRRDKLGNAQFHVEQYMSDIGLSLRLISRHPDLMPMSAEAREYVAAIYESYYARSRLAEIYVIERNFDGTRRPSETFEMGDDRLGVSARHALERETAEYAVQMQQIRRFALEPRLEALVSAEVPLCVGEPGLVFSVPVRNGPELLGIVAAMIPEGQVAAILEKSSENDWLLLASDRGHLFASLDVPADRRQALAAEVAGTGVRGFFGQRTDDARFRGHALAWLPVTLPDGHWYVGLLYDEGAELRGRGAPGALAAGVRAGMVLLLGVVVAIVCRVSAVALAARQQAAMRAAELSASEERFRAIVEATPVPFAITRECDGTFLRANAPLEKLLGVPEAELVSRRTDDFYADLGVRSRLLSQLHSDGRVPSAELRIRRANGELLWTIVTVARLSYAGQPALLTGVYDISERKRAEAALRETNELLEKLLATTHIGIAYLDAQFNYIRVNRAYAAADGREPGSYVGQSHFRLYPNEEHEAVFRRVMATGVAHSAEAKPFAHGAHAERGQTYWDWSLSPVRGASGRVEGVLLCLADVSQRVEAQEEARARQAELAHVARLGTLNELAAGLAHELNQPLAAIVNYVQACVERIRAGRDTPQDLLSDLELTATQAERAGEIVERLRRFARKPELRRAAVDLNSVIREAVALAASEAQRQGIRVESELAAELPRVSADAVQLQQVVVNLLRNSLDALGAVPADARRVVLTTHVDRRHVEFAIRDTGRGLPPDVEQAFAPFYTTKATGLGMGLKLSRTIIEGHGGRLWAERNGDQGATFRFRLPIAGAAGGNDAG